MLRCDTVPAKIEAATRVVRRMPPANRFFVRALFAFFSRLVQHADARSQHILFVSYFTIFYSAACAYSGANAMAIGRLFGPLLIRAKYLYAKLKKLNKMLNSQ